MSGSGSGTREQFGGRQSGAAVEEECSRRKQNRDSGTGNREVCKCNVWSTVPSEPLREYSPSRGHLDLSTSMALHKLIALTPDPRQSMGVKSSVADETNCWNSDGPARDH